MSTDDQNPESQRLYLQKYAQEHGIELVEIFEDVAVSGYETHPFERPGFRRAYELAKQLKCAILTISLDRISRHYDRLLEVLDKLRREGIEIYSIQEEWLNSILSIRDETLRKFIYDIVVRALAVSFQKYVDSIREKTKAGMMRARAQGKHIGRPSIMHDPKRQELFKLVVCKEKMPYRKAAEILGLTDAQVRYWAKKLC